LESRAAGAETGTLRASIQLPYFYISPGVAQVHLAMEIARGALKLEIQKGQSQPKKAHAQLNLLGIATTPGGEVGARFSDTLDLDFDNRADIAGANETVHYEKEFKIAEGKYSFALAFESAGASFGKIEAPLVVEPWIAGELTLSAIALSRETHPAADLGLISSLIEDTTPLIAGATQFVPFGSNQFSRSEAGFFYLEAYDPDPATVTVQVRVLDRKTGNQKWDSGVTKPPSPSNDANHSIRAGASLQLDSLAMGSYQLEILASDSAGKQVTRLADFEIK
jgi:hypothetical protein